MARLGTCLICKQPGLIPRHLILSPESCQERNLNTELGVTPEYQRCYPKTEQSKKNAVTAVSRVIRTGNIVAIVRRPWCSTTVLLIVSALVALCSLCKLIPF